ncbi:group II intron reverse transcriptase/maturase [Haloplasma contractile]|uniref:ATP-dependent Clp protease protease subunit protein n=1 Tax=Haloplasma contractile SSD-17B TaxID=1033810 RepID=U2FLR6_9MOLU|nr:group II intron reverse transcriptase/maturase [Haloplasma contractile]ERJ12134.1 ATP-dependent Clp protease protease subunit protein [Haloplasma contractile SSD-17B]
MTLLNEILNRSNLNDAYLQVYRNKGAAGIDGVTIHELKTYLKENRETLIQQIRDRKYKPQPVKRVEIPKDNGKKRQLGIPTVVDRVIQQAIAQVLTPIYEQQFSDNSYGFRPGRSCEMAIIKSLEIINDGYNWVVDIDLERFFDTVNHDRLINIIFKTIKDGDVMSLISRFLKSGVMVQGKYKESTIGTPQGGNLSPLLSNIMLNELDKELARRGLRFVRYADDCNIYVGSEKAANRVMKTITTFIEKKLGLIVNANKSKIGKPNDIKFLGFGYFYDYRSKRYHVKPHHLSLIKFKRKLKQLTKRSWSLSLDYRLLKIKQLITGWVNYFRISKMKSALRLIDRKVRARIRVIIWKQWKVCSKQIKSLVQLGINEEEAKGLTYCRKGYQFIGYSYVVQRAINNKRLKKRGLASALDHYLKVHTVI